MVAVDTPTLVAASLRVSRFFVGVGASELGTADKRDVLQVDFISIRNSAFLQLLKRLIKGEVAWRPFMG
jgi:hypothetical protein